MKKLKKKVITNNNFSENSDKVSSNSFSTSILSLEDSEQLKKNKKSDQQGIFSKIISYIKLFLWHEMEIDMKNNSTHLK